MRLTGGGVLLAGAAALRGPVVAAQEASPVAADSLLGQRTVVRSRTVKDDHDVSEVLAQIQEGFVPLVSAIPGLALYIAAGNPETRVLFSIGVFADEAGVEESNRIAAEWVTANIPDVFEGDPAVHNGIIGVAAPAPTGDLLGKHIVIRLREPAPDNDVDEMMRLISEGYLPLVEALPGFVAYFGSADAEGNTQAYVTVFDDQAGTEESTRVAGEWLTSNNYAFFTGEPMFLDGVIGSAAN
jgi:hypothetical protein